MTAIKHWLATLSLFALGGATQTYMHETAEAKVSSAKVEAACERALAKGTIEALEDFLHKYPPGKYSNKVACYALALDALSDFGNADGGRDPSERGKPGDGGYRN